MEVLMDKRKNKNRHQFESNTTIKDMEKIDAQYRPRTGEGNGTPLQYSCLESHMDGEAW